jgi:hypothetical protein
LINRASAHTRCAGDVNAHRVEMNFEDWKAAATAILAQMDIDAARIPERVWQRLYAQNYAPGKAAAYAEVLYLNAMSAIARRRHPAPPA